MSRTILNDEEIDLALMLNVTDQWRKVARVVGMTMLQIPRERRAGLDDLYFAHRIGALVEKGFIESEGDLTKMGECEVRLPSPQYNIQTVI